nr:uncharacterized protein CI109_003460 [Kwoniella shandongensis]KAA5528171.1 hypothetical protein CI109_003460 [Kwoniella shandongensis]
MSNLLLDAEAIIRFPTLLEAITLLIAYVGYQIVRIFIYKPYTSPLKDLDGPPKGMGPVGHTDIIMDMNDTTVGQWMETYGPAFLVRGPFGVHHRLFTHDQRAMSHIFNHSNTYTKSDQLRNLLKRHMKEGLFVSEGDRHRVQRKVVQKLFGTMGLRGMEEVVQEKANKLRSILIDLTTNPIFTTPYCPVDPKLPSTQRQIDVFSVFARCMFDIIGIIAIDLDIRSIDEWEAEGGVMFDKFADIYVPAQGFENLRMIISLFFPWIEKVWPSKNTRRIQAAMKSLDDLARPVMEQRQREIEEGKRGSATDSRDLLTMMLRHNMTENLTEDQKLRDYEIEGQLSTFLFAGSETTASTMAFGLHRLSQLPAIQDRLRSEILGYGDNLPYEQIDDLPYLDAVVKEILRLDTSIPSNVRQPQQDDTIPLAQPIQLKSGNIVSEIKIRKGQMVHLPIEQLHQSVLVWGPNAAEFDPSRFLATSKNPTATSTSLSASSALSPIPSSTSEIPGPSGVHADDSSPSSLASVHLSPGVGSNFMTFGDGPRRCVGYKLTTMEIKIMLFTLLREFEVSPVEDLTIARWNM